MDLTSFVQRLQQQLSVAAEAGGEESRQLGARLIAPLESAARLVLLEALSAAVDEITIELAPGSVEVRLRAGEPEFVVEPPPSEEEFSEIGAPRPGPVSATPETEDGGTARLNLRLPETLKSRIEDAAYAEGLSLNAWLVRAAGASLETARSQRRPSGGDRYTGWIR